MGNCVSGLHTGSLHAEVSRKTMEVKMAYTSTEVEDVWKKLKKGMSDTQRDPSAHDCRAHGTGTAMKALAVEQKVADRAAQYIYDASGSSGCSYVSTTVHTAHFGTAH